MAPKKDPANRLIAENRRARFDYFLEDRYEAGLALTGSEVKSLRNGRANIAESYAAVQGDEIMLVNADIPPYAQAGPHFNHEPRRQRKLLLKRKEIDKLIGAVQREGRTIKGLGITPTSMEAVLESYLWRFRKAGQFTRIAA